MLRQARTLFHRLRNSAARLGADRRGNFAVMAALSAVPLIIVAGGVVDITNLQRIRSQLQNTADSAVLAGTIMKGATFEERKARVEQFFEANRDPGARDIKLAFSQDENRFELNVDANVPNNFLGIVNQDSFDVGIVAEAIKEFIPLDVALVLDMSGSMNDYNRIGELKNAVRDFLSEFEEEDLLQVAIVPFSGVVKMPPGTRDDAYFAYAQNPWNTFDCDTISDERDRSRCESDSIAKVEFDYCKQLPPGDRELCEPGKKGFSLAEHGDRHESWATYPRYAANGRDVLDHYDYHAFMDNGYRKIDRRICLHGCSEWETIFKSDRPREYHPKDNYELHNWYNIGLQLLRYRGAQWTGCVIDRSGDYDTKNLPIVKTDPATKYPKANCTDWEEDTIEAVTPLTLDLEEAGLRAGRLVAGGATNLALAMHWGTQALSAEEPLSGSRPNTKKVVIMLTDGQNFSDRWHSPSLYDDSTSRMDERTLAVCETAKDSGIDVYTINLTDGNPDLLRECATDGPEFFHDINQSSELSAVFVELADSLKAIRLSL